VIENRVTVGLERATAGATALLTERYGDAVDTEIPGSAEEAD
jgi:hypothetical protein